MSNNGPTFTKATYDQTRPRYDRPSSARQEAELEQRKRDAADRKLMSTDPLAWLVKNGLDKNK